VHKNSRQYLTVETTTSKNLSQTNILLGQVLYQNKTLCTIQNMSSSVLSDIKIRGEAEYR
jgi:hypothetical protein